MANSGKKPGDKKVAPKKTGNGPFYGSSAPTRPTPRAPTPGKQNDRISGRRGPK